ncbi:MAG: hypothetical protein AB7F31_02950 [Parachlamydiales bacterium]
MMPINSVKITQALQSKKQQAEPLVLELLAKEALQIAKRYPRATAFGSLTALIMKGVEWLFPPVEHQLAPHVKIGDLVDINGKTHRFHGLHGTNVPSKVKENWRSGVYLDTYYHHHPKVVQEYATRGEGGKVGMIVTDPEHTGIGETGNSRYENGFSPYSAQSLEKAKAQLFTDHLPGIFNPDVTVDNRYGMMGSVQRLFKAVKVWWSSPTTPFPKIMATEHTSIGRRMINWRKESL